jgi:hypothetical protein
MRNWTYRFLDNVKRFTFRARAATTALCRRVWRGFWRFVLRVHWFDFWVWVEKQAHPDQLRMHTQGRYDGPPGDRYEVMVPQVPNWEEQTIADMTDRHSRY